MEVKKFSEISKEDLDRIINKHYSHWSQYSDSMDFSDTSNKFNNIYTDDTSIPYGIAMYDNDNLIGFCVLKDQCLINYPEFNPWISDVMIFDSYRGCGNGRRLIELAKRELKNLGFNKVYLWTDKAPIFYEKLGFKYIKDVLKNDESGYGRLYSIEL
ncbi:MAG TPA: hypothetical protein DCE23_05870 [Firmicutes bacterium]|nr:hypothetical protein [Bacillota bacterium]